MPATLDKSRPYGTAHGQGLDHTYVQDGKNFDHDGNEVVGVKTPGTKTRVSPPAKPAAAPSVKSSQLADQLKS